jgi:DHA2 family multidrug resistance protein
VTTPTPNKWLVAAVIVPTTLEMVDTTMVNVALPYIQGNLNASVDEVAWVLTSYLIANGVVIPLTGWLSSLWGRNVFLSPVSSYSL